jgi:hypothetical protein
MSDSFWCGRFYQRWQLTAGTQSTGKVEQPAFSSGRSVFSDFRTFLNLHHILFLLALHPFRQKLQDLIFQRFNQPAL